MNVLKDPFLTDQIGNPCWSIDNFQKKYHRWIISFGCFYDMSGILIVISDPVACVQSPPPPPPLKKNPTFPEGRDGLNTGYEPV